MDANLQNPVEGSLPVENIEPVVCGESDEPIGEDMPVSDSDPGDLTEEMWSLSSPLSTLISCAVKTHQRITDGSVPGVLHGTVQKGGVLSLDGDVDRVAVWELRHQVPGTKHQLGYYHNA